ncbi:MULTISPECIES: integrase core domain-containing protein [unclassified Thioalkalivibrio]|uniref:integrase core domain-containing protein n=1 Tax=unclassified Thioalkalivibrio TaxID=2621013 RepID=UPI000686CE88|nr:MULTISPECIES: integrase core domain-containing protein [unclassified Thioalkalivibrio]
MAPYNAECLGIYAARTGTRFEALRGVVAGFREGNAVGVALRHDHGGKYVSEALQRDLGFLGLESSPALVYAPEGDGVIERFLRTLKEQLLWCQGARTLAELNEALQRWRERYNQGRLAAGAPWFPVACAGPCRLP